MANSMVQAIRGQRLSVRYFCGVWRLSIEIRAVRIVEDNRNCMSRQDGIWDCDFCLESLARLSIEI